MMAFYIEFGVWYIPKCLYFESFPNSKRYMYWFKDQYCISKMFDGRGFYLVKVLSNRRFNIEFYLA